MKFNQKIILALFCFILCSVVFLLFSGILARKLLFIGNREKINPKLVPSELIEIKNEDRVVFGHLIRPVGVDFKGLVVMLHGQGGTMYGDARLAVE